MQPQAGGACCDNKVCCMNPDENDSYCCPKSAPECGPLASRGADGPRAEAKIVCCPPDRWAEHDGVARFCCPPGEKALKRSGNVVGPSGRLNCCPEGQFCRGPGGKNNQCCQPDKINGVPVATCCNGKCLSTIDDEQNCGRCGKVCPPGSACSGGQCVVQPLLR